MQHLTLLAFGTAVAASVSTPNPANLFNKRQQQPAVTCEDASSVACLSQEAQYFDNVCSPGALDSDSGPSTADLDAPCNAVQVITEECVLGANWNSSSSYDQPDGSPGSVSEDDSEPAMLSNATQRACICQSQFFNVALGCSDCYVKHGAPAELQLGLDASLLSSISSSYCAATNTPTAGIADYLYSFATSATVPSSSSSATGTGLTIIDTIGNKTEVSYYFTPSVTGSSAWVVAQATETPSNNTMSSTSGSSSSTSLNTNSQGQIVPTQTGGGAAASSSGTATGTAASKSSSAAAAGKTEAAAVAGVLALAGFVAIL